jgi:hypothetical protein
MTIVMNRFMMAAINHVKGDQQTEVMRQSWPHALEIPGALDLPVGPCSGRPEDPATARKRGEQ